MDLDLDMDMDMFNLTIRYTNLYSLVNQVNQVKTSTACTPTSHGCGGDTRRRYSSVCVAVLCAAAHGVCAVDRTLRTCLSSSAGLAGWS